MNKEEILAKSHKENVLQDEMERTVRIEGESFSLILVFLVGVVIVIFNRLHGLPANSVLAMFWASCVGNRLYRLTKRRNTSDVVTLLISLATSHRDGEDMDEQLVLKNRLKVARAERGLSQGDLAKLVGVSRQTISSIETGQFNPTAKLALVLCIALDKKFEELFYF